MNAYVYPGLRTMPFKLGTDEDRIRIIRAVVERYYCIDLVTRVRKRGRNPHSPARKMYCYLAKIHTKYSDYKIADSISMDRSTVTKHIESLIDSPYDDIKAEIQLITTKLYEYEEV